MWGREALERVQGRIAAKAVTEILVLMIGTVVVMVSTMYFPAEINILGALPITPRDPT